MPTTPMKNLLYRAALPLLGPRVGGHMTHTVTGHDVQCMKCYQKLLTRHCVMGSSLLMADGEMRTQIDTTVKTGGVCHAPAADTIYRVASITKMATALVALRLVESGAFTLDTLAANLLPQGEGTKQLAGITVRQLLCHTSGLRDTPAVDAALAKGGTFHDVLKTPGVCVTRPGEAFAYCNFGFGLLGCVIEQVTGKPVSAAFDELLFRPLGMEATLDATALDETRVMEIVRVLSRRRQKGVRITSLGRIPLTEADPLRHFGHTAGAMYTTCEGLSRLMTLLAQDGMFGGKRLLTAESIAEMTKEQASYGALSPTMRYGLGLVLIDDPVICGERIIGHQGFAYGCVDGAFITRDTKRQVIFLNGGASEARTGRLGLVNRDVLRWALRKELPRWK